MASGRIPQSFIDDLLERVDIVDYINARVPLKKSGKNYSACCPFHDEKTPSFTVSREKQFYYCFGCQAGGNVIGFAMDHHGLAFPEAVEQVAAESGIEVPREAGENREQSDRRKKLLEILAACDRHYRQALRNDQRAVDYLKQRRISGTSARDFGIGYAADSWDALITQLGRSSEELTLLDQAGMIIKRDGKEGYYDRFRDRIIFPIRDPRGRTIAFGGRVLGDTAGGAKYLNSPETEVFHKARELYGLYETLKFAPKIQHLIMVEGYMDVVSLYEKGVKGAVATLGTAVTPQHLEKVFRHVPEVIFCFDGDQAGRTAANRALQAALPLMIDGRQARFLFLPEGEDPDSRVQAVGAEAFEQELSRAMPLSEYLFQSVSADLDLSAPDGRARLHALASPLVAKLPKGVFRRLVEQELSDRTGIRTDTAQQDHPAPAPKAAPARTAPRDQLARQRKSRISPAQTLISLSLNHPALAAEQPWPELPEHIGETERQVLERIWQLVDSQPDLEFGGLYARLLGLSEAADQLINAIVARSIHRSSPREVASREFRDIIDHWRLRRELNAVQMRLRELAEIPFDDLSAAQKSEQRELVQRLAELKASRHDPILDPIKDDPETTL